MKKIITITGIRPDFIRMSEIFKKLDSNFDHILIHTGQHYETLLSDVFFEELEIRKPDYNLKIGGPEKEHFHQSADLTVKLIELIRRNKIDPDLILFLGDSNSVTCSIHLKKEGYKIGHIEAGMRSGDKRMLEEINRIVCDACSDYLFVYHNNYKQKLIKENIKDNIYVVGNTIVEVAKKFKPTWEKKLDRIILDIHRPENFKDKKRLTNIIVFSNYVSEFFKLPIFLLGFSRTIEKIEEYGIDCKSIKTIKLLPFKKYISEVYDSKFIISDSGTGQEEPAIMGTPVIVPRDFTERPESVENNCSFMLDVNSENKTWKEAIDWIESNPKINIEWMGEGDTSEKIINILKEKL